MHPLCRLPHALRQFHQQVAAAVVDERMDRIKAQPVDALFRDPVQCITDDEFPHSLRLGAVKIDCRPPWGLVTIAEKGGGVGRKVVAIGTEVVVDDIEDDHDATLMRRIHERFEIIRPSVRRIRSLEQCPVVAPIAGSGEIRYRYDLYGGDADFGQAVQLPSRRGESSLLCKAAYMHLIQHSFMPWTRFPFGSIPPIAVRIDDLAGPMNVIGLKA